ncbi:cell division cycle 7-related protein kinase [Fopius arisanus]|uniref:non-specific serine/threonine protein kinase n=1 Tax=Fopius arisanus TaxID=64838 RepID=A0A9R1TBC4_9HYME|nr:PREDICTED: cell division cycle 7-related protein kinase [Fopius arisanus]XP_011307016.1 PREDICTED: cell division cycle 7-related protein kinase [Fopius arisanus]XP_011307024.1 PREDICTED: cell division cycle 7-related protein kinase [Fopius arisanus]
MSVTEGTQSGEQGPYLEERIIALIRELPVLGELFNIHFKIGEGTFSSVYLATLKESDSSKESKKFAVKHLIPTYPPARIERELQCLQDIGGADNVVGIEFCIRSGASVAFVMPYIRHTKFSDYIHNMGAVELKHYIRALMVALRKVHMFNIIHRDVKPSNFLYDRRNKRYLLVDFGLAQVYRDEKKKISEPPPLETYCVKRKRTNENKRQLLEETKRPGAESKCYCFGKARICSLCLARPSQVASRAGTPGYRAPEVLFKCPHQTPAIDIWAAGVIMLCILSATQPFFRCPDDCTALAEVTTLFGTEKMTACARKLGKKLICSEHMPGTDIVSLCQKLRARVKIPPKDNSRNDYRKTVLLENFPPEAFDLLLKLLDVDYKSRITADDALNHPFLKLQ